MASLLTSLTSYLTSYEVSYEEEAAPAETPTAKAFRYEFWRGDIPNSYYSLNFFGERALRVTGKPFMVLKYDPATHSILDCEFGLSEVTQSALPTPSGEPAAPEPTLDASAIDFHRELNLKSPVVLLVGWGAGVKGTGKSPITNEVQSFSFYQGTGSRYVEKWRFNYGSVEMTGDVKNLVTTNELELDRGRDSDTWAFKLIKR